MKCKHICVISLNHYDTHRIDSVLPLCHATVILFCVCFMYICINLCILHRSHKLSSFIKFKTCSLPDYLFTLSLSVQLLRNPYCSTEGTQCGCRSHHVTCELHSVRSGGRWLDASIVTLNNME